MCVTPEEDASEEVDGNLSQNSCSEEQDGIRTEDCDEMFPLDIKGSNSFISVLI